MDFYPYLLLHCSTQSEILRFRIVVLFCCYYCTWTIHFCSTGPLLQLVQNMLRSQAFLNWDFVGQMATPLPYATLMASKHWKNSEFVWTVLKK